jgi:hypothetical protein
MVVAGLLKPANRQLIVRTRSPEEALAELASSRPVDVEKWITSSER